MTGGDAGCSAYMRVGGGSRPKRFGLCALTALVDKVIDAIPWDVFPFWSHAQDCEMPAKADHMAALLMSALMARPSSHICAANVLHRCHVCLLLVCARAGGRVRACV